ncbi:MAG: hypothetical protein J6A87_03255, partial [Clostridia bacterium]|nr:hypothetical protein [Clostridia bacterium]
LNEQGKEAYRQMYAALRRGQMECSVSVSQEQAREVWKAVVFDHPELISYAGLFFFARVSAGTVRVLFDYADVDRAAFEEKLQSLVEDINQKVPRNADEYTLIKAIFDRLASMVEYEDDVLDLFFECMGQEIREPEDVALLAEHAISFTPYGVLMRGKGVCQGIAKLFKCLCDSFSLECAVVLADYTKYGSTETGNHMLNVVEVDGERLFVDVTNCLKSTALPFVRYDYFLMPTRVMEKSFSFFTAFECLDESKSYFARNGLWFKTKKEMENYLTSYLTHRKGQHLNFRYDGDLLDDRQLEDFFVEVCGDYASHGWEMRFWQVESGCCAGLLTDDERLLDAIDKKLKKERDEKKYKRFLKREDNHERN